MSKLNLDELRDVLREWSASHGYSQDFPGLSGDGGASHDVVRVKPADRELLLGTCVEDEALRAAPLSELTRVVNHLAAFVELLLVYRGGVFAVAIDDANSRSDWEGALGLLGMAAGLEAPPTRPRFTSVVTQSSSAIVFWVSPGAR